MKTITIAELESIKFSTLTKSEVMTIANRIKEIKDADVRLELLTYVLDNNYFTDLVKANMSEVLLKVSNANTSLLLKSLQEDYNRLREITFKQCDKILKSNLLLRNSSIAE